MIVNRKELNFWERLYLPAIIGGFKVTLRHFFKKKVTMQYPEEVGARGQRSRGAGSLTPETIMAIHSPIGLSELQKMKSGRVRLFIKPHCGWCHQAKQWLDAREVQYEILDVTADAAARQEMFELSGQTLAPVIAADGQVLADFDTDQLAAFWKTLK